MNAAVIIRPAPGTGLPNGLPWKPYTYRGTGKDELTAFMDEFEPEFAPPAGREFKPCGTSAGYRRHRRNGEPACDPCRLAENQRQWDRASRRHAVHRDRGDGSPKCGVWNVRNPRIAGDGEDVTCTRCATGGFR